MSTIKIDADALFRAVTAASYKLLAHHLDLQTGEILSRTMQAGEVPDATQGPSIPALPKLGGDLTPKKDASPFGPPPVTGKKKLFNDDDGPKKPAFCGEFWRRDDKSKPAIFGDGGFRRESGTKKLAEMFGEATPKRKHDPFAAPAHAAAKPSHAPAPVKYPEPDVPLDETRAPRIPVANDEVQVEWIRAFAKDFGDPKIRDEILAALKSAKPMAGFERVLRKYQRMGQQWEMYYRKQALASAEAWIATLGVEWELVEPENVR